MPATSDRGPVAMEQVLSVIHHANPHRLPLTLELGREKENVGLSLRFPPELRQIVETQLFAKYPDAKIQPSNEGPLSAGHRVWTSELTLSPDIFPIRRFGQFEDALNRVIDDPLAGLLATIPPNGKSPIRARMEIAIRPARHVFCHRARHCLRKLSHRFFRTHHRLARLYIRLALSRSMPLRLLGWLLSRAATENHASPPVTALTTSASRVHEREDDLQAAGDKLGKHLFEAQIRLIATGPADADAEARQTLREMAGAFGLFSAPRLGVFHPSTIRSGSTQPARFRCRSSLLSSEELATLWHPSTATVRTPTLAQVESREMEPPVILPAATAHPGIAVLGITAFRDRKERFGILPDDRLRHVAILGKTGMGKSTLLWNLLTSDIAAGRGVALIDPHGDLADSLLPAIPASRTNDVILFDVGDTGHPLAYNPLACPNSAARPLVASGVLSAFKKLYGDSWGPRLEHILRNALLALLEAPGTSLVSVLRLLSDIRYRQQLTARLTDPVVRAFWQQEFARMPAKLRLEAIAPIQNKIGHFASSPLLRNIIGQPESRLDLRAVMDEGKVLIVNLSKGRIGDDASMLLGSLLVTSLQIAAMGRSDIPEAQRREFFLYIDEFQNFSTDSFATILSEARKYRLGLTIANQYLAQMDESAAAAVFGNVGTLLVFQVGANDAEILAEQLGGGMLPGDLLTLPRYQAYARLLIHGMPSRPFSMRTLAPRSRQADERRAEIIRNTSRRRYARPAGAVEADIRKALALSPTGHDPAPMAVSRG